MSGFGLCLHAYTGPDNTHLDCAPGEIVFVHRVERSGWAGVVEPDEGRWGWVPSGYIQYIDDEFVAVLVQIEASLRLGAYRAMTAIHAHATDDGYSSPDSGESDALGDEWNTAPPAPKHRRPSRAPAARPSFDSEPRTPTLTTLQPSPGEREAGVIQFAPPTEGRTGRSPRTPLATSSSFVPPRVRAFRLRSKSHDRGARSDSESATRPRRPSVSLRRTRMSMFGPGRGIEPPPAEEIARLAARPWFLQPKHTPATGDIVIDLDGSIRAGTLEAIAERLTCDPPSKSYEYAFRRAMLLTYEGFTTSNQLFELLTDQYALEPARQLTEEQFTQWKEARLRPTQARVLEVLGMWIALPRLYKDDPEVVLRIREFLQFVNEPDGLASEAKVHLKTIDKLINPVSTVPRPTTSPRRKALKPRPFPSLSPGPTTTALLSPRGLVETALSTSPRLEIPLADMERDKEPESPLARRKSQSHSQYSRDTISSRDGASSTFSRDAASVSSHTSNPSPQPQRSPAPSSIINIDPTALAHHLTLLEATLYMRVKRSQCLEWHRASRFKRESTNDAATTLTGTTLVDVNDLREFCATNDRLAAWVKWTVLSLKTSTSRAEAIGIWVRVAEKCRLLHNVSSLCAIVAGLTSSDIARLNVTASLIATNRAQRLTELQRLTSPGGNFAALKVFYAGIDGPGVPFVGMYLTSLVHASDQFKDVVVIPEEKEKTRECKGSEKEGAPTEPPTPTVTGPTRTLLNFTKRHKQADIIGAMLKFQMWPYTVVSDTSSSSTARPTSNSPPASSTLLTPSTSPTTSTASHGVLRSSPPAGALNSIGELYPYPPSTSSPTVLYGSTGGVAWVEEQLSRAARITLGSDWTYERSMRLFDEEVGWPGVRELANGSGF